MDKNMMRAKVLDVFKNADTDVLLSLVSSTDESQLPVAELDNFKRFLSEENQKFQERNEAALLSDLPPEDLFKSPRREFVQARKPFEALDLPLGRQSVREASESGESVKYDGDLFNELFSGPGSLGVKSPKMPEQDNEFPLGLKAFETSLEPQENHADEDPFS